MKEKSIALYHRIMQRENFESAAKYLFGLLLYAQKKEPNKPRILYVDIEGHINSKGAFDSDMFELQNEFGLGFLLPYFTEVHFPLISARNQKEQLNDIPPKLEILDKTNKKKRNNKKITDLYIENYSNTEFIYEKEVYKYLKKVSNFLREYNDLDIYYSLMDEEIYNVFKWNSIWRTHIKSLINELFAMFVFGNLISAAGMTRSLIECYVYIKILQKERNIKLFEEWFLCSTICTLKKHDGINREKILKAVQQYCKDENYNYEEVENRFISGNENAWLSSIILKKRVTFRDACDYLQEPHIYNDFQTTSSFLHGQDIVSKILPFTFYDSIYHKFYIMMSYVFDTIRLFPLEKEYIEKINELEKELVILSEKYV